MLRGTTAALSNHSGLRRHAAAYGLLQSTSRQATMLSYIDNFRILGIVSCV